MFPKLLCIACGGAALILSGVYITTLNFQALMGSLIFFIGFQILFWKYLYRR